jgi:hypothetical protein
MFDAHQVLETVCDGKAPTDWRVLHARPSYFLGEGSFRLALGLIAAFLTLMALFVVVVGGPSLGLEFTIFSMIGTLGFGAFATWLITDAINLLKRTRTARSEVLVLMPEGCVQGAIDSLQLARAVDYSQILDIALQVGATRAGPVVSLNMHQKGAPLWLWRLDDRFLPAAELAQTIIREATRYSARPRTAPPAPQSS